jgi:hypothetical protein
LHEEEPRRRTPAYAFPTERIGAADPRRRCRILTGEACDASLTAPVEEALVLQRPAPDALLRIVTGGGIDPAHRQGEAHLSSGPITPMAIAVAPTTTSQGQISSLLCWSTRCWVRPVFVVR